MASLHDVGELDGWRCWLCDRPVDPEASVNSDLGPSLDGGAVAALSGSRGKKGKAGKPAPGGERLAHRACNTRKGAVTPVIPWSPELFVVEPAPIVATVARLSHKGGREVVARCPSREDADQAAAWLVDRLSRLVPDQDLRSAVEPGGGQFLLVLISA